MYYTASILFPAHETFIDQDDGEIDKVIAPNQNASAKKVDIQIVIQSE